MAASLASRWVHSFMDRFGQRALGRKASRERHGLGLVPAALLGCLGSTLWLGSAQAATSGTCYFDAFGGVLPGDSCTGYTIQLDDKLFTVKTAPTFGVGKVAFETSPPLPIKPDLWQVNIDWFGAGLRGPIEGMFEYSVEIPSGGSQFASIGLSTGGNYNEASADSEITKTVYQGLDGSGPEIDTVTSINGGLSYSNLIGGNQIFIRDIWNVVQGATIDNLSNYITQTVPGPLPLAAVAAAFGWSRRLRRRVNAATEASAGPKGCRA